MRVAERLAERRRPGDQPAGAWDAHVRRHLARREATTARATWRTLLDGSSRAPVAVLQGGRCGPGTGRSGKALSRPRAVELLGNPPPHELGIPHPRRCSTPLSHRARDAALPPPARAQRPVADHFDDLAGLVHHEAQRHEPRWYRSPGPELSTPASLRSRRARLKAYRMPVALASRQPGCARSPASPPSRCSPTPAPRGSSRRPDGDPRVPRGRSGEGHRDVCLPDPISAHGTNPGSPR